MRLFVCSCADKSSPRCNTCMAQGLKQNGWIDRATRAVFVDFSCYNANTETFISVRLLFEVLATGGIMPYPIIRVLHPLTYTSAADLMRAFFELCFVLYTLLYIVQVCHLAERITWFTARRQR